MLPDILTLMQDPESMQDVLEAATEAEGGPQTPRTPTTEDLEYDIVGTPRQTSDYQGSPNLPTIPQEPPPRNLSRNSSLGSQAQVGTTFLGLGMTVVCCSVL